MHRRSLPLYRKIGTFSRFSSTYRGFGVASRTLGKATTFLAPITVGVDYLEYRNEEISFSRFGYRTGSLGTSIGVGISIGGPPGAVVGAVISSISMGLEYIYDNALVPLWNETNRQIYNFKKGIRNGWYPGR